MSLKEKINLVYIDDDPEEAISYYLADIYQNENYELVYNEVIFKCDEGYDSLLKSEIVNRANVILIDSKLFENDSIKNQGKFSGEEFRMILRKMFPFIEVIVISQNGENAEYEIIPKYRSENTNDAVNYYAALLKEKIDESINRVIIFRNISQKLCKNKNIEKILIEKTIDSLNGISDYEDLRKEDIDRLIAAFHEIG